MTAPVFYDRLTGMGGNVIREDVNWDQVEPQNNAWDWSYLDNEIKAAPPGVGVILMLFNSPTWVCDRSRTFSTAPAKVYCAGQSTARAGCPPPRPS